MSAVHRISRTPDEATLDLWRAAETGDVRELVSVLPRVRDINAQNEHGVTGLMRAAQFGHVKMVRALLEHGADANIKRNDKFTALALAAFFGHTEIVRALMEHGADLQASTRYDTSPHMWATARTFNEVADQLEKPAPIEKPPVERQPPRTQPVAVPASARPAAATPTVNQVSADPVVRAAVKIPEVRTLSDPPEIWDLVHEVPRNFNPRSAFFTRLRSIHTGLGLAFRVAALVVLIGAGVAGVMALRGVQARIDKSSVVTTKQPPAATMTLRTNTTLPSNSQPATANTTSSLNPLPPLAAAEGDVSAGDQPSTYRKPGWRSRYGSRRGERSATPQVGASETVQPVAVSPAKANPEPRVEAQPKPKDSSALSPQMIAPAKSATPKGKVIQWP